MRTGKFNFKDTPASNPAAGKKLIQELLQPSFESSVIPDLSAEVARKVHTPPPPPQTEAKTAPAAENTGTGPAAPAAETAAEATTGTSTANLGENFEKFKQKMATEGEKAIADPKRAAATTLKFLNFIRIVAYPWLMKWAVFEAGEKAELDAILAKVFEAEKQKTPELRDKVLADFTLFEKRVYEKWNGLEAHKKTIAWTPEEINFLVDVGHMHMMEIKFFRWLMGNEFALGLLFIEGRRLAPVVTARMGLGFIEIPAFFL